MSVLRMARGLGDLAQTARLSRELATDAIDIMIKY